MDPLRLSILVILSGAWMRPEKTLVIGLGNPILGDDGVGWAVARRVQARLGRMGRRDVEVDCLALGGISLMERMIGCRRAILIDSLVTGQRPQGSVIVFTLEDLADLASGHTSAAHDTSLKTALEMGRKLEVVLPADGEVHIVAVESRHVYDFKEGLSPVIAAAVPDAVQKVLDLLMSA
jgi:hydrogenase maturation protease